MSLLSKLRIAKGSTQNRKRLGRGKGSGLGQTAGRGGKGQTARSGGKIRRGFEGGQMPLHRRMPKVGFNNKDFRVEYVEVNIASLNNFSGEVTPELLKAAGLVKDRAPVKILAKGKLTKALTVKAHKFSEAAKKAIEAAGGKTELL
jgi:large subunit ribosomal protein L15